VNYQQLSPGTGRIAALLDLLEAGSGLALAVFLWLHMMFVATIIAGPETFDAVAAFLDDYWLSYLGIPPLIAVFFLHFLLAARKIPFSWRESGRIWSHSGRLDHRDTKTWLFQTVSGMAILVLASIHFWVVLTAWPIEAALSSFRISRPPYLVFYAALLVLGELHAGIGLYRLAVKWGWPPRKIADSLFELISAVIILLGLIVLVVFVRLSGAG
jgi:fumarate reductase subunit C